jgi:DNA (cytosine-5)-methyltransferase 1
VNNQEFLFGELFCGPGGMSLGAHNAASSIEGISVRHAWANDRDPDTCKTFIRNIPKASTESVICGDVRELDISSLRKIDGFAFGFPCNDFSLVGQSKGLDGKFGPLFTYGIEVLRLHEPKWFIAENVSGLTSANEGAALSKILSAMQSAGSAGYRLYPHLYSFDQYGVPQKRKRIIIVGIRADLPFEFRPPSPSIYAHVDVTSGNALTNPPITSAHSNNELTRQSPKVVERLKLIGPGQNVFNSNLPEHLQLNIKGATISQIYRKLQADKPAYTITGSGGGGTHVYHWEEPRALTNRERARLQSFPDDFVFEGSKESVRKQIGMAVPAKGAEAIFTALFKTFVGETYDTIPLNMSHLVEPALF